MNYIDNKIDDLLVQANKAEQVLKDLKAPEPIGETLYNIWVSK